MSGSAPFGVDPGDGDQSSGGHTSGGQSSSGGWPTGGWSSSPQQGGHPTSGHPTPGQPASGQPTPGVPTCFRHPAREAHIRCQRCGRPICPDCMVTASVGFQCPECVRQGQQSTRQNRTAFGAVSQMKAYATYVIIGLNVIVFGLAHLLPEDQWKNRLFLLPSTDLPGGVPFTNASDMANGAWWQVITSAFLHVDPLHLLMNMLGLWFFGSFLELALGWKRYLGLYVITALAGSAAVLLFGSATLPVLGASGAVFGLFGAAFVLILRAKGDVTQLAVLLALNLVIGFTASNIAWQAHVGGLIAGAAIGAAYAYTPRERRTAAALAVQGVFLALIVAAIVVRVGQLSA